MVDTESGSVSGTGDGEPIYLRVDREGPGRPLVPLPLLLFRSVYLNDRGWEVQQ